MTTTELLRSPNLLDELGWESGRTSDALLSSDGRYRYWLTRKWADGMRVCWVMLNPSTADASTDDPTIRRCIVFSKAWGFGSLIVVNLWAARTPDPKALLTLGDPVGPDNAEAVELAINGSAQVVLAWGTFPARMAAKGYERLRPEGAARDALVPVGCLGRTGDGHPKHPLARGRHRIPDDQPIIPWQPHESGESER